MARKSGLSSGIGTYTHTIWVGSKLEDAKSWFEWYYGGGRELDLERKRIKKEKGRREELKRECWLKYNSFFCVLCGCRKEYDGRPYRSWMNFRKCDECASNKAGKVTVKFCRYCGNSIERGNSNPVEWANIRNCAACRGNRDKLRRNFDIEFDRQFPPPVVKKIEVKEGTRYTPWSYRLPGEVVRIRKNL